MKHLYRAVESRDTACVSVSVVFLFVSLCVLLYVSVCVQGSHVRAKYIIACSGLHSDRVAVLSGCSKLPKIVPFRGEYLQLKPERSNLVRGNIYPVRLLFLPFWPHSTITEFWSVAVRAEFWNCFCLLCVHESDIPVTETQTDTEMIDISKTHTETNTEKIFNTDTIYI